MMLSQRPMGMVQGTWFPPRTMLTYSSVTAEDSVYYKGMLVNSFVTVR